MSDLHKKIGDELKAYFKEKGITQKKIGEMLGVSQPTVGFLLNGKPFGKKTAEKWGKLFGIRPSWLLTGEGEMLQDSNTDVSPTAEAAAPAANMVQVPADVWEVIKMQAASLQMKDAQIDRALTRFEQVLANYERLFASISGVSTGFPVAETNREGKNPPPVDSEKNR